MAKAGIEIKLIFHQAKARCKIENLDGIAQSDGIIQFKKRLHPLLPNPTTDAILMQHKF